tara:strand:+ start:8385 stop:8564 length:180 start_codon:yes stop_codon:yes gene_type:complete
MSKYDDEEVEFCNACKSLFIKEDDEGNIWCGSCDSLNHTSVLPNIWEYFDKYKFKEIDG